MNGLRDIPTRELIALKFNDESNFHAATLIAAKQSLPVDAPGNFVLILRKSDKQLFVDAGLTFREMGVRDGRE